MTDNEILNKWKPILSYTDKKVVPVKEENYLAASTVLNNFEIKVKELKLDNTRILRAFIPIIRKSLTNSNNNRLDDCIFDIQKNHIIDKYEIILYDTVFEKKAKITIDEIDKFMIYSFDDISSSNPDIFDEDFHEFLLTRSFL